MLTAPLPAGLDLPALHAADPERFPVLLESLARHDRSGRYDLLLAGTGERFLQAAPGVVVDGDGRTVGADLLSVLEGHLAPHVPAPAPGHFHGGYAVLLAYEYAACLEPKLRATMPQGEGPLAIALRTPLAIVRDHADNTVTAVYEEAHSAWCEDTLARVSGGGQGRGLSGGQAMGQSGDQPRGQLRDDAPVPLHDWHEDDPEQFLAGVERIREYIAAGDVFQVNLSRAWRGRVDNTDAATLYARLRAANPAPFAGSFVIPGLAVLSSSPERLVSVRGDTIETRPIAGTRPRAAGDADAALRAELLAHPKERAEHIMLIDLERNDLGRVSVPGSVVVDELMCIESYTHVHHIVSNVRGLLKPGTGLRDVVAAVFPGGTITGCPKIRCMEIIAALEREPRGFYTGAMGFVGPGCQVELNILIRTMTLAGDRLSLRAGAGIVADSVAARELEETRHKARGLLRALGR